MTSGRWAGSRRRETLPADWSSRRRPAVLRRDRWTCQLQGPGCTVRATDVDHIGHPEDHRMENLRAVCSPCHNHRSGQQGGQASGRSRRVMVAAKKRPPEAHPGLL